METVESLLARHPFFADLDPAHLTLIAGCGKNVQFRAGEMIFREGKAADLFYVLRNGKVRLEVASPRFGPLAVQTVHEGQVLGWSWLFPPYRWHFDALAMEPVRATALDGKCLREKLDRDPVLGYALLKRFSGVMLDRLQATRLALLESSEAMAERGSAGRGIDDRDA